MQHTFAPLFIRAATLAPAAETGAAPDSILAEIVTYRLNKGASQGDHLAAARATRRVLDQTGAVIARTLSVDDTGLWTDHIVWRSARAAREAEALLMQRPEFAAFLADMDASSVSQRHAPIVMQME